MSNNCCEFVPLIWRNALCLLTPYALRVVGAAVGAALAAKLTVKFSTSFAAKAAPTRDLLIFTLGLVNNATLHWIRNSPAAPPSSLPSMPVGKGARQQQ
jgi:hypothetical protein